MNEIQNLKNLYSQSDEELEKELIRISEKCLIGLEAWAKLVESPVKDLEDE